MNERTQSRQLYYALGIILAGVLWRLYNVNGALFDFNPLRQALNAFVARHLAFDPGASFLLPRADNMGDSPGFLMFELPVLPWINSWLLKAFGQQNWVFRVPSVLFFAAGAWFFFKICLRLFSARISILALAFYSIFPMSILMSRVFQSESLMFLCILAGFFYLDTWIITRKIIPLSLATLTFTTAILLKITNLYLVPLMFAWFILRGSKKLLLPYLPFLGIILAFNIWWWFLYSAPIRDMFPNEYTMTAGKKVFGINHILSIMQTYSLSAGYWFDALKQCFWQVFSPFLFPLSLLGLFLMRKREGSAFFFAWGLCVLGFFFITPSASAQDYYKLHLAPVLAVGCAFAYEYLRQRLHGVLAKGLSAGFWFLTLATIAAIVFPVMRYKPVFESQQALGEQLNVSLPKKTLLIASFGPDPMLLFYSNRRGWSQYVCDKNIDNIALLEQRRREGAEFFVSGNPQEFACDQAFGDYLRKNYRLIADAGKSISTPAAFSLNRLAWILSRHNPVFARQSAGYLVFDLRRKI